MRTVPSRVPWVRARIARPGISAYATPQSVKSRILPARRMWLSPARSSPRSNHTTRPSGARAICTTSAGLILCPAATTSSTSAWRCASGTASPTAPAGDASVQVFTGVGVGGAMAVAIRASRSAPAGCSSPRRAATARTCSSWIDARSSRSRYASSALARNRPGLNRTNASTTSPTGWYHSSPDA